MLFEARDIQTWAELVGDYNPIHFDEGVALDRGLEGVVAHGMLSLLHLKHVVGQEIGPAMGEHEWVKVNARFRTPVLRAVEHRIDVRNAASKVRFSLKRSMDEMVAIDGTMQWADAPESAQAWETFAVPQSEFEEVLDRYRKGFPGMDEAWLALDCLLFEILLQSEIPFRLTRALGLAAGCDSQSQLMQAALTVQSSHSLHFRADLLERRLGDLRELLPLQCTVLFPTVSAPDASSGFVAVCQMQLHSQQSLLMQSDVGLVVRLLR